MATPTMPVVPQVPDADRVSLAVRARDQSDYVAKFWTAFGWTVLTLGVYSYYIFYQLMRRDRDHTRRRLEVLDAATGAAWERAGKVGLQDELRPNFERLSAQTGVMRQMTNDFRDPVIWLVLSIITGLATLIGYIFMDQDLVKHGQAEVAAQAELSTIYSRLGYELSAGPATTKGAHNYVGRIIATICSFGVYALWWWADIMREGNDHFQANWAWEDNLSQAIGQAQLAA